MTHNVRNLLHHTARRPDSAAEPTDCPTADADPASPPDQSPSVGSYVDHDRSHHAGTSGTYVDTDQHPHPLTESGSYISAHHHRRTAPTPGTYTRSDHRRPDPARN